MIKSWPDHSTSTFYPLFYFSTSKQMIYSPILDGWNSHQWCECLTADPQPFSLEFLPGQHRNPQLGKFSRLPARSPLFLTIQLVKESSLRHPEIAVCLSLLTVLNVCPWTIWSLTFLSLAVFCSNFVHFISASISQLVPTYHHKSQG